MTKNKSAKKEVMPKILFAYWCHDDDPPFIIANETALECSEIKDPHRIVGYYELKLSGKLNVTIGKK